MRAADLGPTPGSTRSALIRFSSAAGCMGSERQLHPRRNRQAGGHAAHLFLHRGFDLAHRVVHRSGDQVLQHFLVVAHQARVDGDAAHVVLAGHHHLDHAGAAGALDLDFGELGLHLGHVLLHLLDLLHHVADAALDHVDSPNGCMVEASIWPPNWSTSSRTNGSDSIAATAPAWRASLMRVRTCCGVCSAAAPISNVTRKVAPYLSCRAETSRSWYVRSSRCLCASPTRSVTASPACDTSSQWSASILAMPPRRSSDTTLSQSQSPGGADSGAAIAGADGARGSIGAAAWAGSCASSAALGAASADGAGADGSIGAAAGATTEGADAARATGALARTAASVRGAGAGPAAPLPEPGAKASMRNSVMQKPENSSGA